MIALLISDLFLIVFQQMAEFIHRHYVYRRHVPD